MKNILLLLFLGFTALHAQNKEPDAWYFNLNGSSSTFHPNQQTSVLTGFQWAYTSNMNNALLNNSAAGKAYPIPEPGTTNTYPIQFIAQANYGQPIGAWGCVFMQYEPTLPIPSTGYTGSLIRRDYDNTNPIFGFQERHGEFISYTPGTDYSRLELLSSRKSAYYNDCINCQGNDPNAPFVLRNIWPNPHFLTTDFGDGVKYVGKIWYLTINLRRLHPVTNTTDKFTNIGVLDISLPYRLGNGNPGSIKFNKVPVTTFGAWDHLNHVDYGTHVDDRGYAQQCSTIAVPPFPDHIIITESMIPTGQNGEPDDITITAEFQTRLNDVNHNYNPGFTQDGGSNPSLIANLDILVKYLGNLDIAIDYIRIESVDAQHLLRGDMDCHSGTLNYIVDPELNRQSETADIFNRLQWLYDDIKAQNNNGQDFNLFRFYYQDLESSEYYWWGPIRYCNLLSNSMFVARDNLQCAELYNYYTKSPNRHIGTAFSSQESNIPAPYIRTGNNTYRYLAMGLKIGYYQSENCHNYPDILNSEFETHIDGVTLLDLKSDFQTYLNYMQSPSNAILQSVWESNLYSWYFDDQKSMGNKFLFLDKPWWMYFLFYATGPAGTPIGITINHGYYRPKTGEELRLVANSALLKGCKGFIYDGDQGSVFPNVGAGQMGIGNHFRYCNPAKIDEYIYDQWVGSDFIDDFNTWNVYSYCYNSSPTNYTLNEVAFTCGISPDRLYIGTRSVRAELFKLHKFIRSVDQDLMDLRIDALLSKGYRTNYVQNESLGYPSGLLGKYVVVSLENPTGFYDHTYIDNFKTRPLRGLDDQGNLIGRKKLSGGQPVDFYEPWEDSTFVDVSLLRSSQVTNIQNSDIWYVGIQNKRTDPLIYTGVNFTNERGLSEPKMAFYSTSELEFNARNGGYDYISQSFQSTDWWQKHLFNRQGCREITVPVAASAFYPGLSSPTWENIIRVTDLGASTSLDNEWFRKEPFFYKVDQTLCLYNNRNITINFQPGEGRILKFERKPICSMIGDINIIQDWESVMCRGEIKIPILNKGQNLPCLSKVELWQKFNSNGNWTYQLLNLDYTIENDDLVFKYVYGEYDSDYPGFRIDVQVRFFVLDEHGIEHQLSCIKTAVSHCNGCITNGGLGNPNLGTGSLLPCGMNFMVPVSHPENTSCLSKVDFETQTLINGDWIWQTVYSGSPATHYSSGYYQFNNLCAVYDPSQNKYRFHGRMKFYSNNGSGDYAILPTLEIDTLLTPPVCCTQAPVQFTVSNCMYNMKYFSLPGCEQVFGIAKSANGGAFTTVMFNPINPLSALPAGFTFDSIQVPVGTPITVIYRTLNQDGNPICDLAPMFLSCAGGIINPETGMEKDAGSNQKLLCYAVPNPATDETTIFYQVPGDGSSDVKIDLFGVMGNYVKTILNGNSKAGINYVKLSSKDMVNGAYFIKVTIGMNTASFPIVIMK